MLLLALGENLWKKFLPKYLQALGALVFAMAWASMASPTLFAVVGDALPKEHRTLGFTVQAILRRIPIVIAPLVGGWVIARSGLIRGMHALFIGTIVCAIVTLFVVTRVRIERIAGHPTNIRGVWRAVPPEL